MALRREYTHDFGLEDVDKSLHVAVLMRGPLEVHHVKGRANARRLADACVHATPLLLNLGKHWQKAGQEKVKANRKVRDTGGGFKI